MPTAKQTAIQLRRRQVLRLWLRKLAVDEIAEHLKVDEKTIDRDLQVIRQENNAKLQQDIKLNTNVQEVVHEYLQAADEVIREFWVNYHNRDISIKTKVGILKYVNEAYRQKIEAMQELGLIPQQPIKIQEVSEEKVITSEEREKLNKDFNDFINHKYQYPRQLSLDSKISQTT